MDHSTHISGNTKALRITAWLTGIYFLIELAIGIYTGSVAVLSDAFHTFSAVGGVLIALIATRIATRPSTFDKTYGFFRAEIIGALLNGIFLFLMAVFVMYMGYMRLKNPIHLPTTPMLIAAVGGLITEFISMWLLFKKQKHDLNMKGAYWHVLQTFVGSIIIIVAALVIKFTGFLAIDPILGMLFGVALFFASWGIIKDSLNILLESVPKGVDITKVIDSLKKIQGVSDIHHVHAWALSSGKNVFSAHFKISEKTDHDSAQKLAHTLLKEKFGFYFSTVQIEQQCLDESNAQHIDITKDEKLT